VHMSAEQPAVIRQAHIDPVDLQEEQAA
jgi:hypothetical protein